MLNQEVWCEMKNCVNNWDGNCEADLILLVQSEGDMLECESYVEYEDFSQLGEGND